MFGDDFQGNSIRSVLDTVDRINDAAGSGQRPVRIHAVGFPVQYAAPPHLRGSAHRFAALMRELTYQNNGTFVGLSDFR